MPMYQFDTAEACMFGVDEAVILQNIRFWIAKNIANEKHFHDGRYWTYNSASAFSELFPFWNQKKIARILQGLEDIGVLVSANYNAVRYDRTKWYSINEKCISEKWEMDWSNMSNGLVRNVQPIPDINTDNKPDIKDRAPASPSPVSQNRESDIPFEEKNQGKLNTPNGDSAAQPTPPRKTNGFAPPSVDEVLAYTKGRAEAGRPQINAESFVAFYQSKGWMVGKTKMKDWKAAVVTWENRDGAAKKPMAVCSTVKTNMTREEYDAIGAKIKAHNSRVAETRK